MTKKHFGALAVALLIAKPSQSQGPTADAAWEKTAREVANALGRLNERFDVARFLRSAGVENVEN